MALFSREKFDSEIFKCNVYKLFLHEKNSESDILRLINAADVKPEMIFCIADFYRENIMALEKLGFSLVSIRNIYKYSGSENKKSAKIPAYNMVANSQLKSGEINKESLPGLAMVVGETSRFFKDEKIDRKLAINFYEIWVNNSFFAGYADEVYIIKEADEVAGFCSVKIKDKSGYIDLIGVKGKYQGKGYGGALLEKAIDYFKKKNITEIFVITEGENVPANAFYQKNGFILNKIELAYHKHYK